MMQQDDWPASRDWTIRDMVDNLRHPNGQLAFSTPTSGRSWVLRNRVNGLAHHPVRRSGQRDARVYDRDVVLALWYKGHPVPQAAASAASAPQ